MSISSLCISPRAAAAVSAAALGEAEAAAQGAPWVNDRGSIVRVQIMVSHVAAVKARVGELKLYLET